LKVSSYDLDSRCCKFRLPDMSHHPIDPTIRAEIMARLAGIEAEHNVRVLFACESGSRGWGFASQDCDYDMRFLS